MKLRILFRDPNHAGRTAHLQITADGTATCGDVARVLAQGPEADASLLPNTPLTLRTVGQGADPTRVLPVSQTLLESGIRSGSVIELAYPDAGGGNHRAGEQVALLRVVSGPDAGVEVPLPEGTSRIGRGPDNDVRLTDPMVSARHARVIIGDRVEIVDDNSANGVLVGGVRVTRTPIGQGDVVTLGRSTITINHLRPPVGLPSTSTEIPFTRPPRVLIRPTGDDITLPDVPDRPHPGRFPWLAIILPVLMGGVFFAVTRNVLSILFLALSPLLLIGNWLAQRADQKSKLKQQTSRFETALEQARADLTQAHATEREQALAQHPSVEESIGAVSGLGELLWSRRPEHPEFLQIRLGLGRVRPATVVDPGRAGAEALPELIAARQEVADNFAWIDGMPVVADLRSAGGLALCGNPDAVSGVARATVTHLAALHSPAEVVLCCLTSAAGRQRWRWLEWLPHTSSPHSPLGIHLSADPGTGRALVDALEDLVASRSEGAKATTRGPETAQDQIPAPVLPSIVVIADQPLVGQARLTRIAEHGPDVGVHVLWVSERRSGIPAACRTWLDVGDGRLTQVGQVRSEQLVRPVACESVALETADALARRMAPLVDAGAPVEDESDLPRNVPVVSLLGKEAADDPDIVVSRWRENQSLVVRDSPPRKLEQKSSLRAQVGHNGVEAFTLDLRTQGPHALVGGTTGAGKSEFLQAWVLGMAHAYSPDRVTFLFVDYKGGTAFSRCIDLPHAVGMVTDLSPALVRRALRSLKAEIKHREELLNAKQAKDLLELEGRGDPDCPPSLVIVIDEFAALAGEVPEFVDGVVDVAQRGRSLGLHLIMATQRPAGVIKDNLRANTNLRVALRMADESDSSDVLGTPMAAHFDPAVPGRGAAKTGPGRIWQFQSAYPGSKTPDEPVAAPVIVAELGFGADREWQLPARQTVTGELPEDIERVVGTVAAAARQSGVPEPRKPWLPPLAELYDLTALRPRGDAQLVLGMLDDPDTQSQHIEYFRPDADGNILFVGASGSGKSSALRTLAVASAITPRSGPVHVYGLDFAGGGLSPLNVLPNVGSIVSGDDDERVARLIRHLVGVADERAVRYSAVAASTLAEYRSGGHPDEPRLLILLDGFGTFRADYESSSGRLELYGAFQRLLVDGRSVGIHFAMTADRPGAVPNSIGSAFTRRVILRQADDDSYSLQGLPRDVLGPTSPPGRAMQADNPQELQLATLGDNPNLAAQVRWLEGLVQIAGQHHPVRPEKIRSLPSEVATADLPDVVGGRPVLGLADATLQPMGFEPSGIAIVSGPGQSGRTTALKWLAHSLRRWRPGVRLILLSPGPTPLADDAVWSQTAVGSDSVVAGLDALIAEAAGATSPTELAVFIESQAEFGNTPAEGKLVELLTACRRNNQFAVGEGESSTWNSGGFQLSPAFKNARTGLLLQPDASDGDVLLRTSLPTRIRRRDFPPGRGFWVRSGHADRVQLPWPE